ncbi:MAG: hypothetical protein ACT4PT_00320 [Methanobacteriota archaeon]
MEARGKAILLLAVLLPFAGCIGSGDDTSVAPSTTPAVAPPTSTVTTPASGLLPAPGGSEAPTEPGALPSWQHGDWWEYEVVFDAGFGPLLAAPVKVVVYEVSEKGYKVAAAERNAGVLDQYFDTFFVGDVGADLNGAIAGGPFKMFDFPLADGKSWPASISSFIDGEASTVEFTLTAMAVPDAGDPAGKSPGFHINGTAYFPLSDLPSLERPDLNVTFEYVYSPLSRWVTSFRIDSVDFNGDPFTSMDMKLKSRGASYEGTFRVITLETIHENILIPILPVPEFQPIPPVETVEVPDGFTFVQRVVGLFGFAVGPVPAASAQHLELFDPDNARTEFTKIGDGIDLQVLTDEPPVTGAWRYAYAGHGTGGAFVGFYGFHEEVVQFTAASHEFHGASSGGGAPPPLARSLALIAAR